MLTKPSVLNFFDSSLQKLDGYFKGNFQNSCFVGNGFLLLTPMNHGLAER